MKDYFANAQLAKGAEAPFTIGCVCFAQPYSVCLSPLKGASRLLAICEAYQLLIQSLISPSLGMTIPNISLALPMKKLAFSS